MSLEPAIEPGKWVCRLTSYYSKEREPISGTGFLVNIPGSSKFCIITAAHNICDESLGWVETIEVNFQGGLKFTVNKDECHVSQAFKKRPTSNSDDEASIYDYGLIATEREKHLSNHAQDADPGGCAFDVLIPDLELLNKQVSIYGYRGGSNELEEGLVERLSLPLHMSRLAYISFSNYKGRATRLTVAVMLEMLSWINDYPLQRVFVLRRPTSTDLYLQATAGTEPNITSRPSLGYLICVLTAAPKKGSLNHCSYVVLPGHPVQPEPLRFLTITDGPPNCRLKFQPLEPGARGRIIIDIQKKGPRQKQWVVFWWPKRVQGLVVKAVDRPHLCPCITQDNEVIVQGVDMTRLDMSPYQRSVTLSSKQNSIYPTASGELPPAVYQAVLGQNLEEVKRLLHEGLDANAFCTCGTSAVAKAAENGDLAILNALLSHGAKVETTNSDRETAISLAERNGHTRVVRRLQMHQCLLVEQLLSAARRGATDIIHELLNRGVPAGARNITSVFTSQFQGHSALELAAQHGHLDAVQLLLSFGGVAASAGADPQGLTALHHAVRGGHTAIVEHLVKFGVDVKKMDKSKMTALDWALIRKNDECVKVLSV